MTGQLLNFPGRVERGNPPLTEGVSVHFSERRAQDGSPRSPDRHAVEGEWYRSRDRIEPLLGGDGVGLDRLSLSFGVEGFDPGLFETETVRSDPLTGEVTGWTRGVRLPGPVGASVYVGVAEIAGRRVGKVECNPSRLADPAGCSLLPLDAWHASVRAMWEAASLVTVPIGRVGAASVKRVDVARDFRGVVAPEFFVRGLLNVRRPYAKKVGVWSDVHSGSAETLQVGSGAGMVRLYDQHAAYADRGAPAGAVRWECEARGGKDGWLARVGVRTVADVDEGVLRRLAAERWSWSRMGEVVTGTANVVEVIARKVAAGEVSQSVADRVLGQLVRECLGQAGHVSNDTASSYEKYKRQWGIRPSADLFGGADVTYAARLDFETGSEVAA